MLRNNKFILPSQYWKNLIRFRNVYTHKGEPNKPQKWIKKSKSLEKIRNIGIMAHIDAGKTTTTERMLFYSNTINMVGEVHHGDTVTDYMDQERERGITITSASVTFNWDNHQINLIDTPGHVDFTMEVERSLRVIDGAVTVLDASAGVEAQTLTVWKQADKYDVPRICYLNKMDKVNADIKLCLKSIREKLYCIPLMLHHPIGNGKQFTGVVDVISMNKMEWVNSKSIDKSYELNKLTKSSGELYDICLNSRNELIENLADISNPLAEYIVEHESMEDVPSDLLKTAVREATLNQAAVPILMGSSYKNTGVQCLMDAIISYLPDPSIRFNPTVALYAPNLCAMAFKVIHNKQYGGVLVFIRIYSGRLEKGSSYYNINKEYKEKVNRVYVAFADEYKEVPYVEEGNVAIISGLKETMTGDTLIENVNLLKDVQKNMKSEESTKHILLSPEVPDPVFYCSIEAPSLSMQKKLDLKLDELKREDPSLTVSSNMDTGQTVLGGMGELHLDIIKDRIQRESKIDAELGKLQISYRETLSVPATYTHEVEKTIGGTKQSVKITLSTKPCPDYKFKMYSVKYTKDIHENLSALKLPMIKIINKGILNGLHCGPILGSPIANTEVFLDWFESSRGTSESFIMASTSMCLNKLLQQNDCQLMEPIMTLEIICPEEYSSQILSDITHKRGQLVSVTQRRDVKVLIIECPLAELFNYSSHIRKLTSGKASFTMELLEYRLMSRHDETNAVKNALGY